MLDKHEDNVKRSIEDVLGQTAKLRRTKKQPEDKKKVLFTSIMESICVADLKSLQMEMLGIDMMNFNIHYQEAIDNLIELHFNPKQTNLIYWFLYDRMNPDGTVEQFIDENNEIIPLDTPDDLYEFIKNIK